MASAAAAARSVWKLYVANVPWTVSGLELKQYFSQFGHVVDAKVIFDRDTGLSKGYGFVEFNDRETIENIFKKSHKLEGKFLKIKETGE